MTLLFVEGFQDGSLIQRPGWDGVFPSSFLGRDGSTSGAVRITNIARNLTLPSAAATCICGFAANSEGTLALPHIRFFAAGTLQCVVLMNASGMIEVRRTSVTGTLLATSSGHPAIVFSTWQHIQAKVVLHTTSGSVVVRLNGVTVINYSGQTSSANASVDQIGLGGNSTSVDSRFDDLWVCDAVDATATQGRANNDFLGDLGVKTLLPTAAGDSTQWTPSTGANWTTVDENPANTTDYVSASIAAKRDLYAHGDLPASTTTVYAVQEILYGAKTDAGASSVKTVIKESGGTITVGASQPLSTTYAQYVGDLLTVRPSDSAVWTASDVNALQAGVELA